MNHTTPTVPPAKLAVLYSGPHYGRLHRVLSIAAGIIPTVTALHEPSGEVVTVPFCDVEYIAGTPPVISQEAHR